ncbi:MAG: M4 family metallopeptidase [Xanthomonadales bacterium]|nr:M4 family metallopeptidase [Xanthomonadales bacterium]
MVAYTRSGADADRTPQADRARALLAGPAALEAHRAAADSFAANDVIVDRDGTEHVRMNRTYAGLPVVGGDIVVHSRDGQVLGVSQTMTSSARPNLTAAITGDAATTAAGADFGTAFDGVSSASKVIYARDTAPTLAYQVVFKGVKADQTPTEMHYIVDAGNGRVLDKWDTVNTAAASGTGKTIYSGNVGIVANSLSSGYELRDPSRGNTYTTDFNNGGTSKPGKGTIFTDADNVWGNNTNSDRASAGADAHFGVATTWDFYQTLGRNGIANNGAGSYSRVHVGRSYVNAFWSDSCFCMSYGDGDGVTYSPLVDLDVAGHEMSHGVTSRSANLTYSGESGGLNEATSDIMGSMVEFYANNALDTPDYLIGEEIYIANVPGSANQKALRYMYRPNKDGASSDCWYSGVGSLDVHYSSGPANHFFYLLAEGTGSKTFSGVDHTPTTCAAGNTKAGTGTASLAGIGRTAATAIWYRALTVYMTSSTNYAGARTATLNAAADLYGNGSANYNAVAAAWSAINVN